MLSLMTRQRTGMDDAPKKLSIILSQVKDTGIKPDHAKLSSTVPAKAMIFSRNISSLLSLII